MHRPILFTVCSPTRHQNTQGLKLYLRSNTQGLKLYPPTQFSHIGEAADRDASNIDQLLDMITLKNSDSAPSGSGEHRPVAIHDHVGNYASGSHDEDGAPNLFNLVLDPEFSWDLRSPRVTPRCSRSGSVDTMKTMSYTDEIPSAHVFNSISTCLRTVPFNLHRQTTTNQNYKSRSSNSKLRVTTS